MAMNAPFSTGTLCQGRRTSSSPRRRGKHVTINAAALAPPDGDLIERLAQPTEDEVAVLDAWWRANNYLTVGQIYLMANPLLREPLTADHIKPRLLGHWGTSPGLSFIYAHASRLIQQTGQQMIYLTGPGH